MSKSSTSPNNLADAREQATSTFPGSDALVALITGVAKYEYPAPNDLGALALYNDAKKVANINEELTHKYRRLTETIQKASSKPGSTLEDGIADLLKGGPLDAKEYLDAFATCFPQFCWNDLNTIVQGNNALYHKFVDAIATASSNLALAVGALRLLVHPATILLHKQQQALAKCAYPLNNFVMTSAESIDEKGNRAVKHKVVEDALRHIRNLNETLVFLNDLRGLFHEGKAALNQVLVHASKNQAEDIKEDRERYKCERDDLRCESDTHAADAKRFRAERDELRDKLNEELLSPPAEP
jgi:hypothetical protein